VLPDELPQLSPGDFTVRTAAGLLDRPGPKRWRELAGERGRVPSELRRG
jgi:hypothetical protein